LDKKALITDIIARSLRYISQVQERWAWHKYLSNAIAFVSTETGHLFLFYRHKKTALDRKAVSQVTRLNCDWSN